MKIGDKIATVAFWLFMGVGGFLLGGFITVALSMAVVDGQCTSWVCWIALVLSGALLILSVAGIRQCILTLRAKG